MNALKSVILNGKSGMDHMNNDMDMDDLGTQIALDKTDKISTQKRFN